MGATAYFDSRTYCFGAHRVENRNLLDLCGDNYHRRAQFDAQAQQKSPSCQRRVANQGENRRRNKRSARAKALLGYSFIPAEVSVKETAEFLVNKGLVKI